MESVSKNRKLLIIGVASMFLFGVAFVVSPFLFSLKVPKHIMSDNVHKFDVSTLEPGVSAVISVKGTPIRITHRGKEQLDSLAVVESQLLDPDSENSKQPLYANNRSRSIKPEIFVFIAIPEYSKKSIVGCSPQPATADGYEYLYFEFLGGYFEACRGAWYDHAGRVYKGSIPQALNLRVPEYRFISDNEIEIVYSDDW